MRYKKNWIGIGELGKGVGSRRINHRQGINLKMSIVDNYN